MLTLSLCGFIKIALWMEVLLKIFANFLERIRMSLEKKLLLKEVQLLRLRMDTAIQRSYSLSTYRYGTQKNTKQPL